MNIWTILLPAISGFIGLIFGSFKPILDWNIEKKNIRLIERKDFLKKLREKVSIDGLSINHEFIHSLDYSRIRPHLSKDFIDFFENHKPNKRVKGRHAFHNPWLLDEIQKIEKNGVYKEIKNQAVRPDITSKT